MAKSLVFVVGAGASKEVGLPTGAELRSRIAELLDLRYEFGSRRSSGDQLIEDALRELALPTACFHDAMNAFQRSAWRIRDAMPQALSIDNFIDSHREDTRIATCGKLAITRSILSAEAASTIYVDARRVDAKLDFTRVENTWLNIFFRLVAENCQADEIAARLSKIAIICFNYDRCIEHFLHESLRNYFGMNELEASDALANLSIYHPYGSVGQLHWQNRQAGIAFGESPDAKTLVKLANGIRTFTEGIDLASSDISAIRRTVADAERLVFLGFAFHRLNLDLILEPLSDGQQVKDRPTYATALGISHPNIDEIRAALTKRGAIHQQRCYLRSDLTCANLLEEYWWSLALTREPLENSNRKQTETPSS
ncbi:hypothetical protein BURK2_04518 [Burkholderiales bacterium]|nr:hypothetical protein BURK2_04518 [Burkholderiales bacterium]